ncbi:SLOG cluster 4 domain-containing protein [Nonomuraea helvata]|uniref:Rossmann fold nucleotide-binding protein n=1 Tax=Nonomuraea helvata TaxID=37484 RepID=A0ABV5SAM6_9ACTN
MTASHLSAAFPAGDGVEHPAEEDPALVTGEGVALGGYPRLYSAADLSAGVRTGERETTFAVAAGNWVAERQRVGGRAWTAYGAAHDADLDDLVAEAIRAFRTRHPWGRVVGVMGGHAVARDSAVYRDCARLGWALAGRGALVITGGGPGVMEAVNLGAYLAARPRADLDAALALIAATDQEDLAPVHELRASFPPPDADDLARSGGLAIASWQNEVPQEANLFAAATARYVADPAPEGRLMTVTACRVLFAPGRVGTVQEAVQVAARLYYGIEGATGPVVFLGRRFWTESMPVRPLLDRLLPPGAAVVYTDAVEEAVATLIEPAITLSETAGTPVEPGDDHDR